MLNFIHKCIVLLVIFFGIFIEMNAQIPDSAHVAKLYSSALKEYQANRQDSALVKAVRMVVIANQVGMRHEVAEGYALIGDIYADRNEFASALKNYLQAVAAWEKVNKLIKIAEINFKIGLLYEEIGVHEKAIEYFTKAYQAIPRDTNLNAEVMEHLGLSFLKIKRYTEALRYYQNLTSFYQNTNNISALVITHRNIVNIYKLQNDYSKAVLHNEIIYKIYEKEKNLSGQSATANNIGYDYKYLRNYELALDYFNKSLAINNQTGKINEQAIALANIGVVYQNMNRNKEAVSYLLQSVKLRKEVGTKEELAATYDILSNVYYQMADYHNASYYAQLAIEEAERANSPRIQYQAYLTSSLVNQEIDEYKKALADYQKHLALRDSILLEERLKQQELLEQQYDIEKIEKELKLYLANEQVKDLEKDFALKQLQLEKEKQEKDFELLQRDNRLKEETLKLQELEKARALQALLLTQQQLNAIQKDKEISQLQQDKQKQELELKQKELVEKEREKTIAVLEQTKKLDKLKLQEEQRSKQYMMVFIGFSLLILLLIIIGYISQKKLNRRLEIQKTRIEKHKEEIELKNSELTQLTEEIAAQRDALFRKTEELEYKTHELDHAYQDITNSVRYAERIQKAMMPPAEFVVSHFADAFLMFLPKDIVSGDFYWFGQKDGKKIIAAVDCTGHGVPGALVSMIGNNLLREIIEVRGITAPNQILTDLNKGVINALKQEQTSNRDGMDMVICTIDEENKKIHFAGAKNPLVLIKNEEIFYIKGDKMPIGGRQGEGLSEEYVLHTFDVDATTYLYLFSDGYQDQFGGKDNRKFLIKNFRELLFSIHKKTMQEQHKIVEKAILEWMGDRSKQTDDIIVIGIKVG